MAIFRGLGGAGDSTTDATVTTVTQQATNAANSATAAANSAASAASSATSASTSATNASSSASAASASVTQASAIIAQAEIDAAALTAAAASAAASEANALISSINASSHDTAAAASATAAAASASSAATDAANVLAIYGSTAAVDAAVAAAASSESAAATSEANAATSAAAAATSEANAATSASSAATSASTATTKADEVVAYAASAATDAATATTQATAASASATAASASEIAASASESAAATSETNAAASASAASTSASAAAFSASNAATSASDASTSASNASTSESNAATSALNASSSAVAAAASETAAAASFDAFDDRYLGSKTSDPVVDNDGNALLTGALYFDSASNIMKVWNGTAWVAAYASLSGAMFGSNNLSDVASISAARFNLGLGSAATQDTSAFITPNSTATLYSLTTTDGMEVGGALVVTGNLTVNGTTTTIDTTNLAVEDNMIYLNSGSSVTNPDLGFAGNYNDGTYAHAGFFRDATNGRWKAFDGYTPEPDASPEIDTSHASFNLAPIEASTFYGNLVGNADTATSATTASSVPYSGLTGTVPTWNQSTTGNAATATYATTAGTANAVPYGNLTGTVPTWNQNTTGNAATATYATTAGSAPASDVYAWAKAATKPSYTYSEVGAPSTTGVNASGTWGISVTGNAATATYATTAGSANAIDGVGFTNTGSNNSVNADTIESNGISYYGAGVPNFSGNATDGALYSQAYSSSWQHQIAGDYRSGQIALRGKNNGTWQSWRTVLDSGNYNNYAPTKTGGGASGTWGINITGNAATATSATSATNATNLSTGTWTVTESAGVLYFAVSGVNKAKLDSSGNLTVVGNVTAYGSV